MTLFFRTLTDKDDAIGSQGACLIRNGIKYHATGTGDLSALLTQAADDYEAAQHFKEQNNAGTP